jgi:hypothetical protein
LFTELLGTWGQEIDITGLKELELMYDDLVYYLGNFSLICILILLLERNKGDNSELDID